MTRVDGEWLRAAATRKVLETLTNAGLQAYFVGGCVRNALLGVPVSDVDIASNAHPDQVIELARQSGLNAIPTGYDHGTVTVVSAGVGHEVTTFRKDIETDGRRARVLFSDNISDDARRRDFTLNALYADLDGRVLDPLGGMGDLRAGRIRFIDGASARIREDYLRTLRFFRFHAWYGRPEGGLDGEALAAISANLGGLETLSRERVGVEVKKLLAAPDPAPAVAAMQQAGVLGRILPGADARALPVLVHLEGDQTPDPMRRLAALGGEDVSDRLRLGRHEANRLALLRRIVAKGGQTRVVAYRHGAKLAIDATLLQAALSGQPLPSGYRRDAEIGAAQVFPVKAADLMPALQGPALGRRLKELEERWIHSGFELTRSQLLD
jgi:poly(A) polymerase